MRPPLPLKELTPEEYERIRSGIRGVRVCPACDGRTMVKAAGLTYPCAICDGQGLVRVRLPSDRETDP
jgi:hypothetical protein